MQRRLRIGSVLIQPILVWDDGEELSPGPPIQETRVPLSEAKQILDLLPKQVEELAAQFTVEEQK